MTSEIVQFEKRRSIRTIKIIATSALVTACVIVAPEFYDIYFGKKQKIHNAGIDIRQYATPIIKQSEYIQNGKTILVLDTIAWSVPDSVMRLKYQ